jgi:hypothetical protein
MGRPKQFSNRIQLPLTAETLAAIDGGLQQDQTRLDFIRQAIEEKLQQRKPWLDDYDTKRPLAPRLRSTARYTKPEE